MTNMASRAPLEHRVQGQVGVIELTKPEAFNSFQRDTVALLRLAIETFEDQSSGVRVVLVCADGKNFCTGADLEEIGILRREQASLRAFLEAGHSAFNLMERSNLPYVAACQGLCLAGGLELMLACDVTIAEKGARFGDQHSKFGVIPGWGGSMRLPRAVGLRRALDLFYSARWVDAETAERWGLVNIVCEEGTLREEAMKYCEVLAGASQAGLTAMKRLARDSVALGPADALAREVMEATRVLQGEDVAEGIAAFAARREPKFG